MSKDHIIVLNAASIPAMDNGCFGKEIDRQLRIVTQDIVDRFRDAGGKPTEARKVKIEVSLTPVLEFDEAQGRDVLSSICVEPVCYGSLPKVKGGKTEGRVNSQGGIVYNKVIPQKFSEVPLFKAEDLEEEPAE